MCNVYKVQEKYYSESQIKWALEQLYKKHDVEAALYWTRMQVFFSLNILALFGKEFGNLPGAAQVLICCIGVISSAVLFNVNRGSKHWQVVWRKTIELFEEGYIPLYKIKSNIIVTPDDRPAKEDEGKWVPKFFLQMIWAKYISVTDMTQMLVVSFFIFWFILLLQATGIQFLCDWLKGYRNHPPDSVYVILVVFTLLVLFVVFQLQKRRRN